MGCQELDEIKLKICDKVVQGQLDASPVIQGILLQLLRKLDKDSRGVKLCGRPAQPINALEEQLLHDAAFQFSLLGKNRELAALMGQKLRPAAIHPESLPPLGLPNPALALCSSRSDQLEQNVGLVHQQFSLVEGQQIRRLCMALDHTYLCRQLTQGKVQGQAGLLGAPWHPMHEEEDACFMPFVDMPAKAARSKAAPLMLEALVWNPCELKNRCFSLCEMPMALKAIKHEDERNRNHGKWVIWQLS